MLGALCGGPQASAVDYRESFDVQTDPAALAAAGWSIVTGTRNPTVVSAAFSVNDDQNVVKLTVSNDAGSQFTSGHVFIENDYQAGEPDNFGRGDALLFTSEPLAQSGATSLDLNGAYLAVDYANGTEFANGPSFYFALRVGAAWYIYEEGAPGQGSSTVTHHRMSTDPLDDTFTFIPLIFEPNNNWNADVRLIPDDSSARELTTDELANVTAFGIYVSPTPGDTVPARFDNFEITNFTFVGVPCPGDLDGDGDVDLADLSALLTNFGLAAGAAPEDGDIDGDGDVDLADLSALLTVFGAACSG